MSKVDDEIGDDAMAKRVRRRKRAQGNIRRGRVKLRESNRVSSVALRQTSPVHKPESNPEEVGQCSAF